LLGIDSLREATPEAAAGLPAPLDARARHVITENARVEDTVAALQARDLPRVGELLNRSHVSLRDDFAISTPAVEATVRRVLDAGAAGARIVGGGFGGHVLGLVPPGATPPSDAIVVEPGPGAHLI
jgi:galactokinase